MKLALLLLYTLIVSSTLAQIGINNNAPHPSAMLDITSITGGLLVPRMTATQRGDITNPPKGLLVYNTSFTRFEYYDGTGWKVLLDAEYWSRFTNYIFTYNKVGLGTAAPAGALDVNGNVKISKGDFKLLRNTGTQNRIDFNYNAGSTNFLTQGLYFNISGTAKSYLNFRHMDAAGEDQFRFGFNGEANATLKASGDFIINSPSGPTIQLQNQGTDIGFVQLAGDDLRVGTNSSNTTGQFIFRADGSNKVYVNSSGNVGIGTSNPSSRLHVVGDIYTESSVTAGGNVSTDAANITSEVRRPDVTGSFNMVPIAYGRVAADGSVISVTPNCTVAKVGTGLYEITVANLNSSCTIIVDGGGIINASYYTSNKCRVINNKNVSDPNPTPARQDVSFSFIIFQP